MLTYGGAGRREPLSAQPGDADVSGKLAEAESLLDRLPPEDPAVLAALVEASGLLAGGGFSRARLRSDKIAADYERLASRLPADHPLALCTTLMVQGFRYVRAFTEGDTVLADSLLTEWIRATEVVPAGNPLRPFALCGVATAYAERHAISGELRHIELAKKFIDEALEAAREPGNPFAPGSQLHGHLLHARGHVLMVWNVYDPQPSRVDAAIEDLERALAEVGPEQAARKDMTSTLDTARIMREFLVAPTGPGQPLTPMTSTAFGGLLEAADALGDKRVEYPIVAAQAASGLAMRALSTGDVAFLNRAIAMLAEAGATPDLGVRERLKILQSHGFALQTRYDMKRDPDDLSNAITVLEDARRTVEQDLGSPYASSVLLSLAFAYRTRSNGTLGDTDRAVRIGLAGLREKAGDVLLQDSDDNALHKARGGSNDAIEMARWFLARDRPEAAVGAIELGRGMVLHAATSGDGVADALAGAGHQELAAGWAERAGEPTDDLRYQAMRALEGTLAEVALLSPPTSEDIAAALARSGADLLCYLIPREHGGAGLSTGMAVLVDRQGAVTWSPLPRLRAGSGSVVDDFLRARRGVEHEDAAMRVSPAKWRRMLDTACDWAWASVIGPLLTAAYGDLDARVAKAGPPRVVLVAVGALGLIPWHAARRVQGGSRPRYACQDAIFSYASSARQFIEASRRAVRPWAQAPVLISDGGDSLPNAALEVAHLYTSYYLGGKVFGSVRRILPDDPPGAPTAAPKDVLAALPHGSAAGASLLHLGCHGSVTVPVLAASLALGRTAGDASIEISVRDILRQARTLPPNITDAGGLVVLAACLTDVTETDYDEALTLATAFLAAGNSGVIAARWAVSDATTMVFMAVFHHYLNATSVEAAPTIADPARALRQAQLWMLDPAREIPARWPERLRRRATLMAASAQGDPLARVDTWAAFTYQGR